MLVTGTSRAIGRVSAEELARHGHSAFATGRRLADVPATAAGAAGSIRPVELDVRDDEGAERVVAEVVRAAGRLDALVSNAGTGIAGAFEETSVAEARAQLDTNVLGVWRLCLAVVPVMRAAGSGLIVNLSSLSGLVGTPYQAAYSASKFAVEGLSESLRLELAPFGIQVVAGTVAKVLAARSPRLRWTVGLAAERATATLKRGLPWLAMERILARTFRL